MLNQTQAISDTRSNASLKVKALSLREIIGPKPTAEEWYEQFFRFIVADSAETNTLSHLTTEQLECMLNNVKP